MRKSIYLVFIAMLIMSESCAVKKNTGTLVRFETTYGDITVRLYPETSKHRDNFVKLVNKGFYNGVLFHRVIAGFMIQAGDPGSKTARLGVLLGAGDVGYTVPAEFNANLKHKRGALAAARTGDQVNPAKASSGSQFYIVQPEKGTHFLDMNYTVYGEITEGFDVIDKISLAAKDQNDRPLKDIKMTVKIVD